MTVWWHIFANFPVFKSFGSLAESCLIGIYTTSTYSYIEVVEKEKEILIDRLLFFTSQVIRDTQRHSSGDRCKMK